MYLYAYIDCFNLTSVRLLICTMQGTQTPSGGNFSNKPERGELTLGMPPPNNKSHVYLPATESLIKRPIRDDYSRNEQDNLQVDRQAAR